MAGDQLQRWQDRIDSDFPRGVLMKWDDPARDNVLYHVPWVRVESMAGLDPVVQFFVAGVDKSFRFRILDYDAVQQDPLVVKVTPDNEDHAMLWGAAVSDGRAASMAPDRARHQQVAQASDAARLAMQQA